MATIRPSARAVPIRLELVDLLLDGHLRDARAIDALRETGVEYDGFLEFCPDEIPPLAPLWRQHRAWLLGEWQRRGGVGPCWAAREFEGM